MRSIFAFVWLVLIMGLSLSNCGLTSDSSIDYNLQVKPILNKHCISCHGGVKQNGGFSLLNREWALKKTDAGRPAIIAGSPDSSEFIRRLHLDDEDERMPLGSPRLSDKEISVLTNWVEEGAKWGVHWAYQPLTKSDETPTALGSLTTREKQMSTSSMIDKRIKEGLSKSGLSMNPQAPKSELLRRLSFDIIGMPAPQELQQRFLQNENAISYESLVDELLALSGYGEKWASMWLDIARYADSKGFERDPNRTIWPYRDYVIKALNKDKKYNDFLIEQLAGDMLPEATDEQIIATGFHRNTTTNDEGGTNNEEYRVKAVLDRVATTWGGIMGTTMACVQCHSHPYDPITHEEFYQSVGFFNNTRDADTHKDYPLLKLMDSLSLSKLEELTQWITEVADESKADEIEQFVKVTQPVIYSIETDKFVNADLYDTKYLGLRNYGSARIPEVTLTNKTNLLLSISVPQSGGRLTLHIDDLNGPILSRMDIGRIHKKYHLVELDLQNFDGVHDVYLKYSNGNIEDGSTVGLLFDWFYMTEAFPGKNHPDYQLQKTVFTDLLEGQHLSTLVMSENPDERRRKTHVFDRGNWQILKEEVQPNVPGILPPFDKTGELTRLDFARWIADEQNPLTARTFVNRVWEQLFGQGIARTVEDLGSQGALPSHPKLLDDLSYQFMHDQGWSIKQLIKTIVLSKAYQQSSVISKKALDKDPYNTYISRGPRVRLSAEQVRDQALYVSGALSPKMYGPPVMPFQPEGIWKAPYGFNLWMTSEGEDLYRRSIYTMIKRSSVYPSLETFDMSQRQVCVSRRIRTNTPLQALVTLNDPVFVEASQIMARRMMKEGGDDLGAQIDYGYQLAMSKAMTLEKRTLLERLYTQSLGEYEKYKDEQEENEEIDGAFLALSNVANAILNLDEMLNK